MSVLHQVAAFALILGQVPSDKELADFRTVETAVTTKLTRESKAAVQPGYLGIQLTPGKLVVAHVDPASPAAEVGLRQGDVISAVDGKPASDAEGVRDLLLEKEAGQSLPLRVLRKGQAVELEAKLATPSKPADQAERNRGSFDARGATPWKKDVYRLAVIIVEYPDVKHNDRIAAADWEDALFSRASYIKKSVTGQTVYGSVNDYYHELSYGTFRLEGKVFPHVEVKKPRKEYDVSGPNRTTLLNEAMDRLLQRDKEALKDFDGIFFMYSGGRAQTVRGSLYWPHRGTFTHQGKRWPYFICPEGSGQMGNISVICHEFGHMLGLPDLYARPENPGSEGVGVWCAMSAQAPNGRPQHFSAWCKERLGWIKPAVIDPSVPQKLILAPIYRSPRECYKILVRPDGSEYFLLENRIHQGFDASLPAQGLLIWRVVRNRPILEESHGVTGPSGPRVFPASVPFPSDANSSFTPYTVPSSRGQLSGGLPVHISNIRRLADGRITFLVGYEFY